MIVHYIYINRHDKFDPTIPDKVLKLAKEYQNIEPSMNVMIHNFHDIHTMLEEYDSELARLFSYIDPDFGACMADIGRILCMYRYGGIYHDAHLRFKSSSALRKIRKLLNKADIIFEIHPLKNKAAKFLTRNTNMISRKPGLVFFDAVLQKQKNNLARMAKEITESKSKRHEMWYETTMPFLEEFIQANLDSDSHYNGLSDVFKVVKKERVGCRYVYAGKYKDLSCYFVPFKLTSSGKFYNNGQKNHWSTLQEQKPLLQIP